MPLKMFEHGAVLVGDVFTVEPGQEECSKFLKSNIIGGIGAQTLDVKYYDYEDFEATPGSVREFVDAMTFVDDDVRYYCTTAASEIAEYLRYYLELFLSDSEAFRVHHIIDRYTWKHNHFDSGFRNNIVVGTPFFNDIFYTSSWAVASSLFSLEEIHSLQESMRRIRSSNLSIQKYFVNVFDGARKFEFEFNETSNECALVSIDFWEGTTFSCPKHSFEASLKPYIYFLSNWTLVLASYLCAITFGQCAFGLYWETGPRRHLFRR